MKKFPYVRILFSTLLLSVIVPLAAEAAPGDLYVGGLGAHVVYKFTPAGVKTTFASGSFTADSIAFDKIGNLFVSDTQNNQVIQITPGGTRPFLLPALHPQVSPLTAQAFFMPRIQHRALFLNTRLTGRGPRLLPASADLSGSPLILPETSLSQR